MLNHSSFEVLRNSRALDTREQGPSDDICLDDNDNPIGQTTSSGRKVKGKGKKKNVPFVPETKSGVDATSNSSTTALARTSITSPAPIQSAQVAPTAPATAGTSSPTSPAPIFVPPAIPSTIEDLPATFSLLDDALPPVTYPDGFVDSVESDDERKQANLSLARNLDFVKYINFSLEFLSIRHRSLNKAINANTLRQLELRKQALEWYRKYYKALGGTSSSDDMAVDIPSHTPVSEWERTSDAVGSMNINIEPPFSATTEDIHQHESAASSPLTNITSSPPLTPSVTSGSSLSWGSKHSREVSSDDEQSARPQKRRGDSRRTRPSAVTLGRSKIPQKHHKRPTRGRLAEDSDFLTTAGTSTARPRSKQPQLQRPDFVSDASSSFETLGDVTTGTGATSQKGSKGKRRAS
ncbi:hypothetical protein H4582DRAFT_2065218 [Lactarius indigo]|nr:hypothetical protein H4582DRAFT_2065218 [Lactarius indigo]